MPRSRLLAVAALTTPVVLGSCGPRPVRAYVAPSDNTVLLSTEMSMSGQGQSVYVANNSTVPIVVTGVHLYDCENIRNRCEPKRLNLTIEPGHRRLIESVRAEMPERGHGFRVRFTWTAKGVNPLAEIPPVP